jgi:hypothetical protein
MQRRGARIRGRAYDRVRRNTAIEEIQSRRAANNQRPTRHHVRDDVFEDHYKTFQFPDAEERVVRVVEEFDLKSWLIKEAL